MLIKLTAAGANQDELPTIMRKIAEAWAIVGGSAQVYATAGDYDLVIEGEAENAMDVTWLGAQFAKNGVSTCTMRAFGQDEVQAAFDAHPTERRYPVLGSPE